MQSGKRILLPMAEIESEAVNTSKAEESIVGPRIIVDPEFSFIHPYRESITQLMRSYGMSDSQIQAWTIELKKTPLDPKSKETQIWGGIINTKKKKIIQIYPETIGTEYFKIIPQFRQFIRETDPHTLRRKQRRWAEIKQDKIKDVPEVSDSMEENTRNIQLLLTLTLHELIDDANFNNKKTLTRSTVNASSVIGRLLLLKILFPISPILAVGTAFTLFPLISKKMLRITDRNLNESRKRRINDKHQAISPLITVDTN